MAENEAVKRAILRFNDLKSLRVNWDSHWDEVAKYVQPNKNDVFGYRSPGEKKTNTIFDATAIQANGLLAAAMHGMLSNPISQFFEFTTGNDDLDKDDSIRAWFQDTERKMLNVLNNSNFQTEIHETYLDLGSFGTAPLFIDEDNERMIRFQSRPIWESYIDENNKGLIDVNYRKFEWTLKKIVAEWGIESLPDKIRRDLANNTKAEFKKEEILHCVEPREGGKRVASGDNKPFASMYILLKHKHLLSNSGFNEFPYVVPRFKKVSGEIYGRSPAMDALPDIKMLNEMMRVQIGSAQKTMDPPLQMPDDGIVLPLRMVPNGINYYRAGSRDRIEPILTGARVDFGFQAIESVRTTVRNAFFMDQMQLAQGPQMTATEVLQRTEEKLRMLGPLLGRLQFELLAPMIDRMFNILRRKKLFQDPPARLSEVDGKFDVRYTSQIVRAQRTSEAENLLRAVNVVAPIAQGDPSILDNINGDEALRHIFRLHGLPQEVLRSQEEIQAIREQKAQAAQMDMQNQQELDDAEKIQKAGPTLSQGL